MMQPDYSWIFWMHTMRVPSGAGWGTSRRPLTSVFNRLVNRPLLVLLLQPATLVLCDVQYVLLELGIRHDLAGGSRKPLQPTPVWPIFRVGFIARRLFTQQYTRVRGPFRIQLGLLVCPAESQPSVEDRVWYFVSSATAIRRRSNQRAGTRPSKYPRPAAEPRERRRGVARRVCIPVQ